MRSPARKFEDLIVWQKAHKFVISIYKANNSFPASERYGLNSQIRRAAVSIAAYIAEGFKKNGIADKIRFLNIAQGSLEETRYYLILSKDLGYLKPEFNLEQIEEVSKLLDAYCRAIQKSKL